MPIDLSQMTRASKKDPVPGTVEKIMEWPCPACGSKKLTKLKACCGAKNGYLWCPECQFEKIL